MSVVGAGFALAAFLLPAPRQVGFGAEERPLPSVESVVRDRTLPAEGYRLQIGADRVTITAADEAGEFYARTTLRELRREGMTRITHIDDAPAFRWRGLMLDEARHFFGKTAVKRFLDRMARLKMNVLHWHLADHQGWRLEIKRYPELTAKASARDVTEWRRLRALGWLDPDRETYGPYFYTQDDVREIVAYAETRHVTVVPEIEIPGHCRAVLKAHPSLQCVNVSNRLDEVEKGYRCAVVCAGNDETLRFYENVLDEVCALFPSSVIHLGGDEARTDFWRDCPRCQVRRRTEGLSDEGALQGWLLRHFEARLAKRGRRAAGWDECANGAVSTNLIALCWRGTPHMRRAVSLGHDVVACPEEFCYFDFRQGFADDGFAYHPRGNTVFAPVTSEKVYSFDPRKGLSEEESRHVLGGQGNCWTELTLDEKTLDRKTWARAAALAEALWTASADRDFKSFESRQKVFLRSLREEGRRDD